jgi:hypothetical protein
MLHALANLTRILGLPVAILTLSISSEYLSISSIKASIATPDGLAREQTDNYSGAVVAGGWWLKMLCL